MQYNICNSHFIKDGHQLFVDPRQNLLYELEMLSSNIFLVTDKSNRRLGLLDFNTQLVGSVCFNGENPCTTSSQLPKTV